MYIVRSNTPQNMLHSSKTFGPDGMLVFILRKDHWYLQSHFLNPFAYNVAIATVFSKLELRPRAVFVSKKKLISPYGETNLSRRAYSDHA